MSFNITGDNPLYIDASDMEGKLKTMQRIMCKEQYEKLLYRTLKEVGAKTRTITWNEIKGDYEVKRKWVYSSFGKPETQMGGYGQFPVSCVIPLSGKKGVLGPTFAASGGSHKRQDAYSKSQDCEIWQKHPAENHAQSPGWEKAIQVGRHCMATPDG